MQYTKPPLTYPDQIALMESRGLQFPDKAVAIQYLERISYYRLSAYSLPFQGTKDVFDAGTTFDQVLDLYVFDRELRLLVLDAIERIEVAVRAQLIYQLSHRYGAHWTDNPKIFVPAYISKTTGKPVDIFQETQQVIIEHCSAKNPEVFIKHYVAKYDDPVNPPSWMTVELLTIGQLSRLFSGLRENDDRKSIADYFGLHRNVLATWMHTLTYVRNICAHHARLWNRSFAIKPDLLKKPVRPWMTTSFAGNSDRCFYFLCTLKYLLDAANPGNHFKARLAKVLEDHPAIPVGFLGIPSQPDGTLIHWQTEPLWA